MIDQKPRDPLYPQGFEDIDNLKHRQIPRPKPKENEYNDLKIKKSFNQKLGKYIGPKPKNIIENEESKIEQIIAEIPEDHRKSLSFEDKIEYIRKILAFDVSVPIKNLFDDVLCFVSKL